MTDVELIDTFMSVMAKTKRPGPPPPPPPPICGKDDIRNCAPPPPPPPPPLGCGRILIKISENEGISVKEIAEQLGIRPPSVSEIIQKLDEKGLIDRQNSNKDKRSARLFLTELGHQAAQKHRLESERFAHEFFSALSEAEKETLNNLLKKLL